MLSHADNEIVTRTGPGTAMGNVMRRYWVPALMSSELPEPDCAPVRVQLLSEKLVAFRDTNGRIGLIDEYCPHRRASLFLGRNEACGLRCVYHGWKFDVDGNCVDMMNEPPESRYKTRIHITAYPTAEMGGVVWAYLGPRERTPALPAFEWTQVAETHRHVSKIRQECNWLQALEGGIDTAHAPILHRTLTADTNRAGMPANSDFVIGKAPVLELDVTDYGYRYAGIRSLGERGNHIRTHHFLMPFHQLRPKSPTFHGAAGFESVFGHMWVPLDDESCMVYNFAYSFGDKPISLAEWEEVEANLGRSAKEELPGFRSIRNVHNNWLIDRKVQKTETFTGIEGVNNQDLAVQESMGPIVDRTKEHLSLTDRAVVTTRRLLLQAAKTVAEGGDPPGLSGTSYRARAIEKTLPADVQWRDAMLKEMYPG
jgi:phthalate 4,5-dioxygenase oxygenase subunit